MTKKAILTFLVFVLFTVPLAQCFTLDNSVFNFVGTHGGNVRYANSVQFSQLTIGVTRFVSLFFNGINMGNLVFDCDNGVNMTITEVTRNSISYTIAGAGIKHSYVTYERFNAPISYTGAFSLTYDAPTGVSTVTHVGNDVVTITYGGGLSSGLSDVSVLMSSFFGLICLSAVLGYILKGGDIKTGIVMFAFTIMVIIYLLAVVNGLGY